MKPRVDFRSGFCIWNLSLSQYLFPRAVIASAAAHHEKELIGKIAHALIVAKLTIEKRKDALVGLRTPKGLGDHRKHLWYMTEKFFSLVMGKKTLHNSWLDQENPQTSD